MAAQQTKSNHNFAFFKCFVELRNYDFDSENLNKSWVARNLVLDSVYLMFHIQTLSEIRTLVFSIKYLVIHLFFIFVTRYLAVSCD